MPDFCALRTGKAIICRETDRQIGLWRGNLSVSEISAMPIQPLLVGSGAFSPEEIAVITTAFEETLSALGLVNRKDPAVHMVAKRMFELASGGEHDPILLRDEVLKSFRRDTTRL
jgi:hypothetical protein